MAFHVPNCWSNECSALWWPSKYISTVLPTCCVV